MAVCQGVEVVAHCSPGRLPRFLDSGELMTELQTAGQLPTAAVGLRCRDCYRAAGGSRTPSGHSATEVGDDAGDDGARVYGQDAAVRGC